MTSSGKLMLAALAAVVLTGAALGEVVPLVQPAPRPAAKAPVSDPAEPPMTVEVSYDDRPPGGVPRTPRGGRGGWTGRSVPVAGGAKGATLTLETPGWSQGWASLTFNGSAPPMRFTMRLTRMPNAGLSSLSLTSGALSLRVGPVTASATTRHFDAKGQAQEAEKGAAYTLTARRRDNGEVEVQLRRGPGAALGKELTVSWERAVLSALRDLDGLIEKQ
jgi:hypothetical protein